MRFQLSSLLLAIFLIAVPLWTCRSLIIDWLAPKVEILVASRQIDIGEPINRRNVRLKEWARSRMPRGAITDVKLLEDGLFARVRSRVGHPILLSRTMIEPAEIPYIGPGNGSRIVKFDFAVLPKVQLKTGQLVDVAGGAESARNVVVSGVKIFDVVPGTKVAPHRLSLSTVYLIATPRQHAKLISAAEEQLLRLQPTR